MKYYILCAGQLRGEEIAILRGEQKFVYDSYEEVPEVFKKKNRKTPIQVETIGSRIKKMLRYLTPFIFMLALAFTSDCQIQYRNRIPGEPRVAIGVKIAHNYLISGGGQSNQEGIKLVTSLPDILKRQFQNVYIWVNTTEGDNLGSWQKLQAGVNNQRSTAAAGSDRLQWYGWEIPFADKFERQRPNDVLYIIKYGVGSSAVAIEAGGAPDWNSASTNESLDVFIEGFQDPARANLSSNSISYTDLGLIWMQGEQDASNALNSVTATFRTNSINTFAEMRTRVGNANWPIYVCRLNASIARDPTQLANVRTAQGTTSTNLSDVATYPNNHFFNMDLYSIIPGDTVHTEPYPYGLDLYNVLIVDNKKYRIRREDEYENQKIAC